MKNAGQFSPILSSAAWFDAQPEAWFDADLTSTFTSPASFTGDAMPAGVIVGGGSNGRRLNAAGTLVSAPAGLPRFDHIVNGAYSAGTSALLVEPLATNRCLQSEDFSNASWYTGNSSISTNATSAPDGATTADKLVGASGSNLQYYVGQDVFMPSAGPVTASCWVKAAGKNYAYVRCGVNFGSLVYTAVVDLSTGSVTATATVGSPTGTAYRVEAWPGGLYRIFVTQTDASGTWDDIHVGFADSGTPAGWSNGHALATGNGTDGIYVWGAQVEQGYGTSYIPTTSAAATRAAEQLVFTLAESNTITLTFDDGSTQSISGTAGTNIVAAASLNRARISTLAAQAAVTGNLAASEALDSAAITAALVGTGTLAASEAPDAAALSGSVGTPVTGTLAATEALDSLAVAAALVGAGTLAGTEAQDSAAVAGAVSGTGTLAATETRDAAGFTLAVVGTGALASSEAPDSASIAAALVGTGALAAAEAADAASLAATLSGTGALAATEAGDSAGIAAAITGTGTLAATESADVASIAGGTGTAGSLAASEPQDSAGIVGALAGSGALAATEAADGAGIAGSVVGTGTLAANDNPDTAAIAGGLTSTGTLTASEAADSAALAGTVTNGVFGAIAATDPADGFAAGGNVVPFIRPTHSRPAFAVDPHRSAQLAMGTRTNAATGSRPAISGGARRPAAISSGRRR